MSISDLSFCDHGYTKIKICPSCLREKDDQIDSLKSLLRSAHEIITQDFPEFTYADWVVKRKSWLASYGKIKAE